MADEAYIRESILSPAAKVVAGYQPVMPTYQGQVSEESLLQLIAYIQSLKASPGRRPPRRTAVGHGRERRRERQRHDDRKPTPSPSTTT